METLRSEVLSVTRFTQNLLRIDLKALPVDKHNFSPGGCARTPLNTIAECARTNGLAANFLNGVESPRLPDDKRKALLDSYDTAEKVLVFLDAETDRLVAAIEALDEVTMNVERPDGFFGTPSRPLADAEFGATHMMYHVGQLNYIQSLYGDDKIHWWK